MFTIYTTRMSFMLPDEFQYVLCGTVFRIETNTGIDFDSEHWTFVLCLKKDSANLEECFCTGGPGLEHDGEDGEDDDLDGGPPRVPVGSADSVLEEGIQFHGIMLSSKLYYDIIQKRKSDKCSGGKLFCS